MENTDTNSFYKIIKRIDKVLLWFFSYTSFFYGGFDGLKKDKTIMSIFSHFSVPSAIAATSFLIVVLLVKNMFKTQYDNSKKSTQKIIDKGLLDLKETTITKFNELNQEQIARINNLELRLKNIDNYFENVKNISDANIVMIVRDFILPEIYGTKEYFVKVVSNYSGLYENGLQCLGFHEDIVDAAKYANKKVEIAQLKRRIGQLYSELQYKEANKQKIDYLLNNTDEIK